MSENFSHVNDTAVGFGEESESSSSVFDSFYKNSGSNAIRSISNFTAPKFDEIRLIRSNYISAHWNVGRGRKINLSEKKCCMHSYVH